MDHEVTTACMVKRNCLRRLVTSLFRRGRNNKRRESVSLDSLYYTISYRFREESYLRQALTHRSFLYNKTGWRISNERLEFLGDAVLGMVVTDELYHRFPKRSEGELTKAKSCVVNREMLAREAKKMGLGDYLYLGSGEERSGGRNRKSILSDMYEALIGAIYLDGGLDEARRFISQHLLRDMDRILTGKFNHNYKSWLLEHVQGEGGSSPEYRVLEETGPDHKKEFTVEVRVAGKVLGMGRGYSKKKAEQDAAFQAIKHLGLQRGE